MDPLLEQGSDIFKNRVDRVGFLGCTHGDLVARRITTVIFVVVGQSYQPEELKMASGESYRYEFPVPGFSLAAICLKNCIVLDLLQMGFFPL